MVGLTNGDTWGISGPMFLTVYGLLALMIICAWVGARRQARAAAPMLKQPVANLLRSPEDLAYLNGGSELAIYSTLSGMRLRDTVTLSRGTVRATGTLDRGGELARAIHRVTGQPTHRAALTAQQPVMATLNGIENRLVQANLLVPAGVRRRLRQFGLLMFALAGLGVVRLLAGLANLRPVGFLILAIVLVMVTATIMLNANPRRTRLGERALAELRTSRHDLDPKSKPDWTLYGPEAAMVGVGLFGVSALWASDPAMATELAAQRAAAAGSAGGADGGGSSCGGGGGGGGGGCGG